MFWKLCSWVEGVPGRMGPSTGLQPECPECAALPGAPGQAAQPPASPTFLKRQECGGEGPSLKPLHCYSFPVPLLLLLCNLFDSSTLPFTTQRSARSWLPVQGCECPGAAPTGLFRSLAGGSPGRCLQSEPRVLRAPTLSHLRPSLGLIPWRPQTVCP